jgi:hypothetical protein
LNSSVLLIVYFYLKNSTNYREIGFSPASSAQSDSGSNSNHTSESSNNLAANLKQTQVKLSFQSIKIRFIFIRPISSEQ